MSLRYKILAGLAIFALLEAGFLAYKINQADLVLENLAEENDAVIVNKKIDFSDKPAVKDEAKEDIEKKEIIVEEQKLEPKKQIGNVPFTPQAPLAEWSDSRQQDGCEEAASLMAVSWARGGTFDLEKAEKEIISASEYELKNFGEFRDASSADTLARIIKGYFNYSKASVQKNITVGDIIAELEKGNIVITPMNGQLLNNPFYTPPGPIRHMLVIKGYDSVAKEFITNDSGTKNGKNYRYAQDVLYNAIRDYLTGYHEPIVKTEKNMIIVMPE